MRQKVLSKLKPKTINHKKVMGFDIETKGINNEFVLATFYSEDLKFVAYSKEEVVAFISNYKLRNYNVFATNLGFDFLGTLYEHSDQWSVLERNGTIYSFKWYQEIVDGELKRPVNFYDTLRLLPFSVEKLGKLLGVPKIKHPSCFAKEPQNPTEWRELKEYCMNDSRISYEFIVQIIIPFLEKYDLKFKCTIGSIALDDFRTNHLTEPFFQETEEKREFGFLGYYGGRTETFRRGNFKNVYCFDINSLYPSVMVETIPNPNKSNVYEKGSKYNIINKAGVSDVIVHVPETMKIPPLPYHKDNKLIFPVGTFRGFYNHNELANAIKYGVEIIEIFKQIVYKESKKYFKSYVELHYAERLKLQKENNPLQIMEKNLLNNLYGKFAFNFKKCSSLIPEHDFDFEKHVESAKYVEPMLNNKFISVQQLNPEPPIYSFPIFSSYITSYARIKMFEYLVNPEIQNKIISMDTDSIFLDDYKGEIETSNKLGDMKLEDGYPIENAIFVRPKMYKTFKPKCKGVHFSDNADKEFKDILNNISISQDRFIKFRTAIRSQTHHQNGILKPNQIIKIEKTIGLEDTKREWLLPFNKNQSQDSKPLNINYEDELKLQEEERLKPIIKANAFYDTQEVDFTKSDVFDKNAVGHDITLKEFIENEKQFEVLELN